jgi:hypothetical protein
LTVDNKDVDIASLSTREAEDYLGSRPPDVSFGPRDAAEQALSIKGRIDALDRQIRESTAKIRVANKLAPYSRRENTWPSETSVTIWTLPHLFAAWKKWGPLNIWSAEKGQRQATGSRGYMLGQTPYYFLGMARVIAAYGKADVDERDPDYHRKFMQWIEQPIEDEDLVKAGISDRTKFQDKDGGLRIRYALLGDLTGEAYVLSKLAELRATEPQAGGSPAMEVKQGVGEPAGQYDQLSKGTSKVVSKSQWPGPLTGNEMELIGFHDANFHSIWDLASAQVVVDAVRSFTPIASYGIPGHGAPEKTIQAQVEIPAIQKEARLQKEEIGRLVEMLRGYYITHVDDHKVKDGLENLSQGIGKYAEGADALAIDLAAKNFNADGTISEARLKEDVKRKAATVSMREGGASIRQGLGKLKGSDSYRKYKFK